MLENPRFLSTWRPEDLSMLETLRTLPAYYWLILMVIAVAAIYYLWARKTTPKDPNEK
jgi:hypothetical protein